MKIFLVAALAICFAIYSTADDGRGSSKGPPTITSYNCTVWEHWLNTTWRQIRLPHAYDCTRFYECDDKVLIEKACADRYRTRYDPFKKRCEWNYQVKCTTFYDYSKIMESIVGKKEWMV